MMKQYGFSTRVLAASIRDVTHFENAVLAGVDAITVPVAVLEKTVEHSLTDKGMMLFLHDWQSLGSPKKKIYRLFLMFFKNYQTLCA